MAENLDDGEFWLPPQFLDDEVAMEESKCEGFVSIDADASKGLFPFEFPYGFGSCRVASDVSSPGESVVASSETESDEEEHMAELTRQMAHSTLGVDFEDARASEKSKGMFLSGSPQSTLCAFGSGGGYRKGSNHGSPNSVCKLSSPKPTWDLLHAAAGEVERMRLSEGYGFNHQRGLLGPPRNNTPLTLPANNANPDVGFHTQQSLSHQQLQAAQFQMLRQRQEMAKQQGSVWGAQKPKATGPYQLRQSNHQMVPNRVRSSEISSARSNRVVGLSPSAWPPLQQAKQQQLQNQQFGSGMRAVFLGNPAVKRECAGTGVFLPRRADNPAEPRRRSACSTVLVPARVAQALNLKLENMVDGQLQYPPRFNGSSNMEKDAGAYRLRNNYVVSQQKRNLRPQPAAVNHEIGLPQEWTY